MIASPELQVRRAPSRCWQSLPATMTSQPCGRRRFLRRLVTFLLVVCLLVFWSAIGLLTRLQVESRDSLQGSEISGQERTRSVNNLAPGQFLAPVRILQPTRDMEEHRNSTLKVKVDFIRSQRDWWQRANPDSKTYKLLVYSAYWDNRTRPACVRVIGTTLTKLGPIVVCTLHFQSGETLVVKAQKKAMNEHWNLRYAGFFFSCCADKLVNTAPDWVTVNEENASNTSARIAVHSNLLERFQKGQLALCVKPLHYSFDRAVWLLEFIEYYRMQGVEHFLFYNDSVGPNVEQVLSKYEDENIVTILPWAMDVVNQKEIRTENMFAALNDCVYRLMYLYEYVVSVDFDEFIVPRTPTYLSEMLSNFSLLRSESNQPPSYVFQNAFFYLYWENDTNLFGVDPETSPRDVPYLLTQYKTRRLEKPHVHGKRSKYIAVADKVVEAGNHITWRHIGANKPMRVPAKVALLHHYRICEYGGFDCLKLPSMVDRTAHRFGLDLYERVLRRCGDIFPEASYSDCPLSPPLGSPW